MDQPTTPQKDRKSVAEFFQSLWTQALGTMSAADEEVQKLLGRMQQSTGWSPEEVLRQVREFSERLTTQRKDVEKRVEDAVRQSLLKLKVPRREELAGLSARLDALSKRIEALSK